jgi:hypothetical protein
MLSLFLPLAVACGGSASGGSSSVSGTVGGTSFTAASQIAVVTPVTGVACTPGGDGPEARCTPAWKGQAVEIFITNREGATCEALRASIAADEVVNYARFDDLGIVVGNQRGELAEGKYDVIAEGNPVSAAGAQLRTTTSTCAQDLAPRDGGLGGERDLDQGDADRGRGHVHADVRGDGVFHGELRHPGLRGA